MGSGLLILLLNIFILYYIYRYSIIIIISIFINIYNSLFFFLPSIPFRGGGYVILKLSSVICHEGVTVAVKRKAYLIGNKRSVMLVLCCET